MTADALPIRAESLLQHGEFVRALARSLVRDEHAAQDVVQETWIAALRHPPRSAAALPAWLARVVRTRAQNATRGESRRVAREREVARGELDESEEKLRERVALQHRVVEAVLGLKEPYKTVVLLHYYEGLSPAAIAARRDMPAGSVRAQLSRAHDLLRERLDAEFGGSRAAWSVGLAALARGRGGMPVALKLALLGTAAVVTAVTVPVVLRITSSDREPAPVVAALEPTTAPASSPALTLAPEPTATLGARSPLGAEASAPQAFPKEELESLPVRHLLQLAIHVQQALRAKLLTPAEDLRRTYSSLLALPHTGLARILRPDRFGTFESNALGLRGAGACFSFATGKQGWDDEPDFFLDGEGTFRAAISGPRILDLGERRLEDLPDASAPVPAGLEENERAAWELSWTDCGLTERAADPSYTERSRGFDLPPAQLHVGHAYLVRGITPGAHDVLAAFIPIAEDQYGWTIAWRVLHTWSVRRTRGENTDPNWALPDPPVAISSQSVEALVGLLGRIRAVAQAKLYEPPAELKAAYSSPAASEGGIARLLTRGRYGPLVEKSGEGAYFSFATGENDYQREPDLGLEQGMYSSRFYGQSVGLVLDLGTLPLESIGRSGVSAPEELDERRREGWHFLWTLRTLEDTELERTISAEDEETARGLGLDRATGAEAGHTYLVRTIQPGYHDVLAAFTTAARDEHGDWIEWRLIWNRRLSDPTAR